MTRSKVKKDKTPKEDEIFSRKDAEFRAMCAWIERELFNYNGTDQHLHTKACLRLQGLRKGQNIANNKHDKYGNYSVECVFNTFKANKLIIQNAIKGKDFADEYKKMAYICAIIEVRINEMYLRNRSLLILRHKIMIQQNTKDKQMRALILFSRIFGNWLRLLMAQKYAVVRIKRWLRHSKRNV